jgi:hypothetical protein
MTRTVRRTEREAYGAAVDRVVSRHSDHHRFCFFFHGWLYDSLPSTMNVFPPFHVRCHRQP